MKFTTYLAGLRDLATGILMGLLIALALSLLALPAKADHATCAPRAKVMALIEEFGGVRQSIGIAVLQNGTEVVHEVFSAAEDGSWLVLVTDAEGTSCIEVNGIAFENTGLELMPSGTAN